MPGPHPTRLSVTRLEDRSNPSGHGLHPMVVTGAGAGDQPIVQVSLSDGTSRLQFFAFDPAFRGGVNVASADVNFDGVDDIIVAAGAGGGPHVKVFDGKSLRRFVDPSHSGPVVVVELTELYSFFAYDSAFRGGVNVASGDVDADGYSDIVTGAGAGGGPHVKVYSGKTGAEIRSFFAFDSNFRGGVNVAVGQLQTPVTSGHENNDIFVGSGAGMKATVVGFNGRTAEQFFSLNPYGEFTGGVYVASADMTRDGFDDLVTGAGAGGGPHVTVYNGYVLGNLASVSLPAGGPQPIQSFFAFDEAFRGGVRVAANSEEQFILDAGMLVETIVVAAGPGGGPHVKVFNGHDVTESDSWFKHGLTLGTPQFSTGSSVALAFGPTFQ